MAKHIKGAAVANASSYKLYLADGTELKTQTSSGVIDFDLSDIAELSEAGTYSLGVKAIGDGIQWADSVMSNLVSYTVAAPIVYYTITYKYMSGSTSIKTQTTEQVAAGTTKTFSISGAPAIDGYTVSSVSPSGQQTINSNITVTYTYAANVVGGNNNIMPIARYFVNPYLKEGLLTTGSAAHRSALFYLPTASAVTFDTDYAATRTDFTFLAKYTSGDCDEVEQIILQTPSAKDFTTTLELQQGYYGVCWSYGTANANPTEDEMIITTPAISSVVTTDIEATAEFVSTKYLDATTGAIKTGSANYAIIKFHLDKQYNGGVNLYNTKASTRFSNLVKFTDSTYSTVDKVIIGPAAKVLLGCCLTDLETGYYATMIENSSGPDLSQCAISGYEYN